jgi:type IV secretory pathway VirB2 component (pilin)
MNVRRVLAVVLLIVALAGIVLTRGVLSLDQSLPVVMRIAIAAGAAACALAGTALWVKAGGKARD